MQPPAVMQEHGPNCSTGGLTAQEVPDPGHKGSSYLCVYVPASPELHLGFSVPHALRMTAESLGSQLAHEQCPPSGAFWLPGNP